MHITDFNTWQRSPADCFDSVTNKALLGGGKASRNRPVFGVIDLSAGSFTEFTGIGFGFVNGLAIDSADGIAVSTTEDDASVEYYNLSAETGFVFELPGSQGLQQFSGADVEFDSVHKLFSSLSPFPVRHPAAARFTFTTPTEIYRRP